VLEAEGFATVALANVRPHAERARPPRSLYCEFPLGRPLGIPGDAAFQHRVLRAAFDLLRVPTDELPVLRDFDETIVADTSEVLACTLPPRFDATLAPAQDEALALRPAHRRAAEQRRAGTDVGRRITADEVPDMLGRLARSVTAADTIAALAAEGVDVGDLRDIGGDIRQYYEEVAVELAGHVPAARSAERWFFTETEAGALLIDVAAALRNQSAAPPVWMYVIPGSWHRPRPSA
jgi:hypothetical protein